MALDARRPSMRLPTYLRLIAHLKLTLTVRHFQRNLGSAVMSLIGLGLTALMLVGGLAVIGILLHTTIQGQRDSYLFWALWVGTLLCAITPLGQLDAQRNIDLTGLRLLPLTRLRFTLAVLLDGALSPLAALSLLAALAICAGFTYSFAEAAILAPTLLLLAVFQLGCAQAIFLLGNRIFTSRRFSDFSLVGGLVFFLGLQVLNLAVQNGVRLLPPWLREVLTALHGVLGPLGDWLAPGVALRAFSAASQGWLLHAAGLYALLAVEAGFALLLATWAAKLFYEGELESGGAAQQPAATARRRAVAAGARSTLLFPPLLAALLQRERSYFWRDPLVKMQLIQSLFGTLYLSIVVIFLAFRQGDPEFHHRMASFGKYMLLVLALMLGLTESAVLFNKFGYEGGQIANVLITPASRRALLLSKSIHLVSHFVPLNLLLALMAGLALHAPPLFIALALLLVITNTLLLDVVGQYVSIYYPFAYRRAGRRVRAVMPQPGCGYVFVYTLIFQLCHLLTTPVSGVSIALTLLFGWPGFAAALAWSGGVGVLAYRLSLPDAALRLQQREPQLLAALAKGSE